MPPQPAELHLPPANSWAAPAALCAALALGLVVQAALPASQPDSATVLPSPARKVGFRFAMSAPTASGSDGSAALARPPFSPSRAATGHVASAQTIGLLGLARVGGAALATVQDPAGAIQTLKVGERFQGWRLAAVVGDRAVLEHDGESQALRVGEHAVGAAAAPTPSAGAPPVAPSPPGGPT